MVDIPSDLPYDQHRVAAFIAVWAYAFDQASVLRDSLAGACRGMHVCGPAPLKPLPPLASGYESGNTVSRAAAGQFDRYSRENPDWDICIRNTRSLETHESFNRNYKYRMEGEFFGVPRWRSLWDRTTDFLSGRTYTPSPCPKS